MNIYFKYWLPKDVDVEVMEWYGIRFGRHSKSHNYNAWDLNIVIPGKGVYELTITDNHAKFLKEWGKDFKIVVDWQLFP
jgi:hypothetical protein